MPQQINRHLCQGTWNVFRFNWHLHLLAALVIIALVCAACTLTGVVSLLFSLLAFGAMVSVLVSFLATWIAYDASDLYQIEWLAPSIGQPIHAVNIHAGFDEITPLLRNSFPQTEWQVFDFYQAEKHTEISIQRARRAHPPASDTVAICTEKIPCDHDSIDCIVLFLAAHEIRDRMERVAFFLELKRVLSRQGMIIVTEHLRDLSNIVAYSIGAWHFHARSEWMATFHAAGLLIAKEQRNNLFITTFFLVADENTH